jgi:hypothetical protein
MNRCRPRPLTFTRELFIYLLFMNTSTTVHQSHSVVAPSQYMPHPWELAAKLGGGANFQLSANPIPMMERLDSISGVMQEAHGATIRLDAVPLLFMDFVRVFECLSASQVGQVGQGRGCLVVPNLPA